MRLSNIATSAHRAAATLPPRVSAGLARLDQFLRGDDCPPRDGGILVVIGGAAVLVALFGIQVAR